MSTHSEERAKSDIVAVARAMLEGTMGIIEGSRRLSDLRAALRTDHLDDDFVAFVVIDSETETLPIGDARSLWNSQSLVDKDRDVDEAERLYRDRALEACRRLIARFEGSADSP